MTSRRSFLAGALALASAPLGAQDKPAARVVRIGMLETVPIQANNTNLAELHRGLKELGYAEGANYAILYRSSEGHAERFPGLAADLAKQKVDVYLTRGTPATLAARDTESGIPVVASAIADSIDGVTGMTSQVTELSAKRMEFLKALAPGVKRVGALINPDNPASLANWKMIEGAAPGMNLKPDMIDVRRPDGLGAALDAALKNGVDGLIFGIETFTNQAMIIDFTAKNRLPAVYAARNLVESGGLLSYGVLYSNLYYRSASYIDKVLKGAKPADLPIEKAAKFELVMNRKTAHALKIAIPPDLLLRSDEIID
ncbi:MAG TPA: ABC transporter substrate-binding protein [Burkholderiales bacterium]|nr:ABC transporter substrate-binding protein [Burkholderiales bacterium]